MKILNTNNFAELNKQELLEVIGGSNALLEFSGGSSGNLSNGVYLRRNRS